MMTLNEAINHCEKVTLSCAKSNRECALEHIQLIQWLKELRALRKLVEPKYLDEIKALQHAFGKEWEEHFNQELCKEVDLEKEFDKCCKNYIFDDECEVYTARRFFELGIKAQK